MYSVHGNCFVADVLQIPGLIQGKADRRIARHQSAQLRRDQLDESKQSLAL